MKILVDVIFLSILYIFKLYQKWKQKGKDVLLVNTTMYIYLSFVLFFTLMPIITSLPFIFNQPLIDGFRSADITDLMTNTIGGIIGYIFYIIFRPLTTRILKCIKDK